MNLFLETQVFLCEFLWLWLVAIYKAVMPANLLPHKDIEGWTVLVTGSGSGIGRLIALRFSGLGCRLVLWDIDQAGNEKTAELIREAKPGAHAWTYTVDLSRRDQVYEAAKQTVRSFLPVMVQKNRGHVVTVASSAGMFGTAGMVDYCSSKFTVFGERSYVATDSGDGRLLF
ncbi:hypothetical protein EGW08_005096 [Elysia chlorotica]|uniref:Uncharacterized protein n=1 Tax=Elysia chlorotica TaxID=188477 RepID=A0A3S1BMM1_ELYCH|nr:hypothetical protein EGW08_005096 [Elysia chlorotica]